ncbi:ABC transporter ATP-binding protein [Anaeromyxobacter oryzisoli]|uniref:ABC transporter ATP-binding protein n=1 Tax=Anaeromyxobacter oryzisoli TaxID=2925408 RepID=UPI001F578A50|nr:ABC transporter ATP-binding protein [Anaeromyxobacter sp. SG63]
MIRARNLVKNYSLGHTTVHALRGVDLDIARGEHLCVSGPSGAGKSTLLNILGLLDDASAGEFSFDGVQIGSLSDRQRHRFRRDRIAFVFQSFNLVPVLDARENIEFPLLIQKVPAPERKKRILQLAEEVGIRDYLDHKPDELSGGQRQRVAIARALVTKPQVVFADEPTANLDSVNGAAVLDVMRRLNREEKTTFVVASHDQVVMREADRMIRVVDGVVADV